MQRTKPHETKITICVWHPFTQWRPTPGMAEAIRKHWPDLRVVHLPDYARLTEEIPDTDIFVGYSLKPEQLAVAPKLKWIHSTAAGVSQLTYPELRSSGVIVTNPKGIFSVPMAEHIMGMLLALARNFPDCLRHQERSHWGQQEIWDQPQHLTELNGRVLLIVGFGSIGRELARRAKAFDMRVWGVSRTGKGDTKFAERIVAVQELEEVLPHADYVVIAAPETLETKHLIGAKEFACMKQGARLINVARGSLINEAALTRALSEGPLGGAALDVAETEPLPADSALWKAPRLFITPHTSAISDRLWDRETQLLIDLLEHWFNGRELYNCVDLARGY
ncbi:MAG: D-2-hydroxyacid dehydrogenase [Candidatus Acidiferrum sp.]